MSNNTRVLIKSTVIACFVLLGIFAQGCTRRFEDGPTLSFRSPQSRVTNSWIAEKVIVNEYDDTDKYSFVTLALKADETFEFEVKPAADSVATKWTGSWGMANNKEQFFLKFAPITPNVGTPLLFFDITELRNKKMSINATSTFQVGNIDDADYIRFDLIPKP